MITLQRLLDLQRELMHVLETPDDKVDPVESRLFKDVLVMLGGEVHEALAELTTDTKPWKQGVPHATRIERVEDETIDVLFFLLEAFILLGFDEADIWTRYKSKHNRNLERLKMAKMLGGHMVIKNTDILPEGYAFVLTQDVTEGMLAWRRVLSSGGYSYEPVKIINRAYGTDEPVSPSLSILKLGHETYWNGVLIAGENKGRNTVLQETVSLWKLVNTKA